MKNWFEHLKTEHDEIGEILHIFKKYVLSISEVEDFDGDHFRDFILFFSLYADKIHHGKEEDILFPQAYASGLGHKSGSHCTLFFGRFLDHGYLDDIKADLVGYEPPISKYTPKPILREIIENKSPLVIPLEEHEIGVYSMQIMVAELDKKGRPDWSPELLLRTARRYANMLKSHIDKEDQCLFPMLANKFSPQTTSELASAFEEFDRLHSDWHLQAEEIYKKIVERQAETLQ